MYNIKTMNKIAPVGLERLPAERYLTGDGVENEDAILVRSAKLHDYVFPEKLWAIARAGAGVNNIPVERCSEAGVVVFNTPGANANAVKELVLCAMLLASRDVIGGAAWVKEQAQAGDVDVAAAVEKGKSAFVGPELYRKALGVIGLGAIGSLVANIALSLGMDALYASSDYITLHLPYMEATKDTVNAAAIAKMKDGVRIINMARGGLVNNADMIAALQSGKAARYVTDFPDNEITLAGGVVAIPHLGASTPESEDNCAVMAADQLRDFLENGNIKNSVNFPNVIMERSGVQRLCVIHRNVPAVIAQITTQLGACGVNVENMTNKSKGEYAYTMVDAGSQVDESIIEDIRRAPGVIRMRVI